MKKLVIMTLAAAGIASAAMVATAEEEHWSDAISMKGDLRFRHEYIDNEAKKSRTRQRVRARLSLKGEVNEDVDVHIRLASGSDDPTSSNQSLDGGSSTKNFNLDRAYFDWHPDALPGVSLWGGKMKLPFAIAKDLVWDGDLNPEGLAVLLGTDNDGANVKLNAAALWAEERSSDSDTLLYGAQLVGELDGDVDLTAGVGIFYWDNMDGYPVLVDDTKSFGNTSVAVIDPATAMPTGELLYEEDYTEVEVFFKAGFDAGVPVKVFGDYVVNTEASGEDTGWQAGFEVGKAKDPGSASFEYSFRDLEADAVVGAFSDSDFIGGGTGGEGHKLKGKYQLAKNWQFNVTYFISEIDGASKTDYDRAQIDLIAKF